MMLGIIPARAGSKTIPNKNIKLIDGCALIDYTVRAAKESVLKDTYVISTDSKIIWSMYNNCIIRPTELAQDDSKVIETIRHVIDHVEVYRNTRITSVVLLQPTSPLRDSRDIDEAIKLYKMNDLPSLYSGSYISIKETGVPFNKKTSKKHFQRNGAIFITDRSLIDKGIIWDDNPIQFVMPKYKSIDIDDYDDFFMTESILKNRGYYVQGDC